MTKKKLLIIIAGAAILICAAVAIILITAGGTDGKIKKFESEAVKAISLTGELTMKDGDTLVYSYNKETVFTGDEGKSTVKESKLNSAFTLVTTESSESVTRESFDFLPIKLSASNSKSTVSGDKLSLTVPAASANAVLGVDGETVDGDITVICALKGGRIVRAECVFITKTAKNVVITYVYGY